MNYFSLEKILSFYLLILIPLIGCSSFPLKTVRDTKSHRFEMTTADQTLVKSSSPVPLPYGLRKRVMVLPFYHSLPGLPQEVVEDSYQKFLTELDRSGQFIIIESERLPQGSQFYFDGEARNYPLDKVALEAEKLSVSALIEGELTHLDSQKGGDSIGVVRRVEAELLAQARLSVYSVPHKKVIFNESSQGNSKLERLRIAESTLTDRYLKEDPYLSQQAVERAFLGPLSSLRVLLSRISWQGRIAYIEGEKVFINAGQLSGLQIGDLLKVSDEGAAIYDPGTALWIGTAPGRMKGTLEIIQYFGKDGAIATVHSGAGFLINDRVDLY